MKEIAFLYVKPQKIQLMNNINIAYCYVCNRMRMYIIGNGNIIIIRIENRNPKWGVA